MSYTYTNWRVAIVWSASNISQPPRFKCTLSSWASDTYIQYQFLFECTSFMVFINFLLILSVPFSAFEHFLLTFFTLQNSFTIPSVNIVLKQSGTWAVAKLHLCHLDTSLYLTIGVILKHTYTPREFFLGIVQDGGKGGRPFVWQAMINIMRSGVSH